MRSQGEIVLKMEEIRKVCKSPKDAPFIQFKVLMHKLEWNEGKMFLKREMRQEQFKAKWEKTARLDEKYLRWEIKEEALDLAAMHVVGQDQEMCMIIALKIFTLFWLFGPKKDKYLKLLWQEFLHTNAWVYHYEPVFKKVAEEVEVDWERLKLRYTTGMFTRILDKQGKLIKTKEVTDAQANNRPGTGRDGVGSMDDPLGTKGMGAV